MKINKRLLNCLIGYQLKINGKAEIIGERNAKFIIEWLNQCKFEIVDKSK